MKKSVSKRIKITKNGKMLRRKMALGHFRSKVSGSKTRQKKRFKSIATGYEKKIRGYLSN